MRAAQQRWHIFCRVVDNFGDIGVCWRLAKQLTQVHHQSVTLWVDDLPSFHQICHQVDTLLSTQRVENIDIHEWPNEHHTFNADDIPTVIIGAFACELPAQYRQAMQLKWRATKAHAPEAMPFVWINLEYLSAETWVEDCHLAPSPVEGMCKTFFFPGFTTKTGGILFDAALTELSTSLHTPEAKQTVIEHICQKSGVTVPPFCGRQITLFAYPNAVFTPLIDVLINDHQNPTQLWLLGGTLNTPIGQQLGSDFVTQNSFTCGALTITRLPFLNQEDYDLLLALADLNCVRGEESFVRAQMVGKPMLWHIYPQDEAAHQIKLNAFLALYTADITEPDLSKAVWYTHLKWNNIDTEDPDCAINAQNQWLMTLKLMTQWQRHATIWQQKILNNGDLTTKLVKYCSSFV